MSIDTTVRTIGGEPQQPDPSRGIPEAAPAPTSRRANALRWRVPIILVPLFIVAVLFTAMSGMGKTAEIAQANKQAQQSVEVDPAVVQSVVDALPEDTSEERRKQVKQAVERTLSTPEGANGQGRGGQGRGGQGGQQGGGALGGLLMVFIILSILVVVTGVRRITAEKQRGISRRVNTIALPIWLVAGLITMGLGIVALNKKPEERRRPNNTLAVMADRARIENVQLSINTQGEARPQIEIDLVPQVGGKIVYVSPNFVEGGIFRRGETLVRIDPADAQVAVIRAEAAVAQAEQTLTREIAEGQIARADYEELGRGTPSPLALREPQRQQAEAALTAARADLENARLQLTRTSVTAPFAGRVRSKTADVGQFVAPGTRLGRIFSTDIVEVRLPLTDADLAKIDLPIAFVAESREAAPKVTLSTTLQGERREWEGRIMRTDASYDTQTRALFAIAEVVDPYGAGATDGVPLAPGLFVDARIDGRSLDNVIVLPRDGLRPRNEVYVVDDTGKAEIREASVIDTSPDRAVLRPGVIREGEIVVVSPMERSRIETPLKVLDVNDPSNVIVEPPSRGGPPAGG